MATTTGARDTVDSDRPPPLPLDSIPIIDLSLLSQSELFSLSMCSNSSFDLNRCDDVVIPKIDRSVFNESAGSRKQTYSRLRLAPAQSSTSTKTTIHRRTPRLRSPHTPTPNNVNDAEQAENSQIIRMLKELFKSDHNFEDLVPIEVEIDTNILVPELLNPETNLKRKRPRKHEDSVFIHPPAAKRMRNNTVKKVVAYNDNVDIETVNSRGVKVNLENLGRLEDPYGLEIRRRTEGMSTIDELLGFLGRLDGEWATSRKKRRVVDANDFGDALPKGWRLSLSIKKKFGRVWLFCRRYISPSGRQFESCKEVSMYLLSLVGEENSDKSSQAQSNNCDDLALKGPFVNARNRHVVLALSSSLPRDSKKQVKSNIVDPINVRVEEVFKCLKCFMIFEGKVSLLDHQVLAHKTEISQLDSEWVVLKGRIFECEFCNKTFNERNQYNEHIGTHGTNDKNTSEALEAPTAEKTVDPVLDTAVPDEESRIPVSADSNVVMESDDSAFGGKLISASSQSDDKIDSGAELKIDEPVHDLNNLADDMNADVLVEESGDEIEKKCNADDNEFSEKDKAPDISDSKSDFCLSHEASMPIDESNGKFESCGGTVDCVDDKSECILECNLDDNECHERDKAPDVSDSKSDFCLGHEASMSIDESNGKFETSGVTVDCFDDKCDKELDGSRAVVEKDIVGMSNGQDAAIETGVTHGDHKPESSGNSPLLPSTNELMGSVEKNVVGESASVEMLNLADSETRVQSSDEEKGFWENINETHICSSFDDFTCEKEKVVNSESPSRVFHGHLGPDEDCVAEVKKLSDSETPSNVISARMISFKLQDSPQRVDFAASADHITTHDFEENRFSYGIANARVDGEHEFRSSAFESDYMSSIDGVTEERVNEDVRSKIEEPQTEMNMEDFDVNNASLNQSGEVNVDDLQVFKSDESINNEVHGLNLNTGVMGYNAGENLEFCSLVPSVNEQAFSFQDDDDVTGIYDKSSDRGFLDHFSIAETCDDIFGTSPDAFKFDEDRGIGTHDLSLHSLYENTINLGQKEDDVQTNLSMVNNNSMIQDQKGSLPCNNNETRAFYHNGSIVYPGQCNEVAPNQGFRVDERYNNDGFNGRSEPVEFRFLGGRSEHDLQAGSSGVFPYNNTGIQQGFGSAFWNGKNPSMGGRNVITSVCAWCRNEFHLQPPMGSIHPESQGGIGSLCPTCRAGFSGQVNML